MALIRTGLVHVRYADRRGNRLDTLQFRSAAGHPECLIAGPSEAAVVVEAVLAPFGPSPLAKTAGLGRDYTHAWGLGRLPPHAEQDRLMKLVDGLYLRTRQPLDAALALDWYKQKRDQDVEEFEDTGVGSMLNAAKYRGIHEARVDLADALAKRLLEHPMFSGADCVVSVPGSRPTSTFSTQLACDVARRANLPIVHPIPADAVRSPAKDQDDAEREEALTGRFSVSEDLSGLFAVIVDDVFRRGRTMRSVAYATQAAGASRTIGLAGARTLRSIA
jgi:adenine/guanine phosphoribosyltransferase-like PRPP-binding protein